MKLTYVVVAMLLLTSCITQKKFDELSADRDECRTALEATSMDLERTRADLKSMTTSNEAANVELNETKEKLSKRDQELTEMMAVQTQLNSMTKRLTEDYERLLKNSSTTSSDMSTIIEEQKRLLTEKEKALVGRERSIEALQADLKSREARVNELESIISAQNKAVSELRNKVSNALLGFKSNELTVEERDGKVYVSLSEKLLFKSGSAAVDPKGADAISKLATVLNENPDIEIMIEGHTDSDAFKSASAPKDNWDLSVLRATSIVRILQENSVKPARIIAAGRGEYHPVAANDNAANKALNRRTEIVLSPNLSELMELLQSGN